MPGTGGQGRAALFDAAAVSALRDNQQGVEFLARMRYAFEQDHGGNWREYPPWNMGAGVLDYLRCKRRGRKRQLKPGVPDEIDLVPLAAVPDTVKQWARGMVKLLTAKEVYYLQSMFYASEYQPAARGRYDGAYAGAFRVLSNRIGKRIYWLWRSKPIIPRNMELLKSIALRYNMPADMFTSAPDQQRDRLMQWVSDYVFGMIRGNDYAGLRRIVQEFAPKNRRILGGIIRYAKLENTQAKLKYALPSPPAVAAVLGLTRMQGYRQWQAIRRKLRGQYLRELEKIFGKNPAVLNPVVARPDLACLQCGALASVSGGVVRCSACDWQISVVELQELAHAKNDARTYKKTPVRGSSDG